MEGGGSKHQHPCLADLQDGTGGEERQTDGPCQSAPRDEQHHLVKPVPTSHRQMLCFCYDNGRPAKLQ